MNVVKIVFTQIQHVDLSNNFVFAIRPNYNRDFSREKIQMDFLAKNNPGPGPWPGIIIFGLFIKDAIIILILKCMN